MEKSVVNLSLISHTNAGKTTLLRTLLRKDVGEVRDAAHVTAGNDVFIAVETAEEQLALWDTPGFGDTSRLLNRIQRMDQKLMWFFSQAWDRLANKALWSSQMALRNVRDDADVVLYLINASEPLQEGHFVDQEMEILSWLNKPVLILLNQTGVPRLPEEELAELKIWADHLRQFSIVKGVLNLDAFTRCWVQEDQLMSHVEEVVPEGKKAAFTKLKKEWHKRNEETFSRSMEILAHQLTANAAEGYAVKPASLIQKMGFKRAELNREYSEVRQKLSESLATRVEDTMNKLIEVHELDGKGSRDSLLGTARENFAEPQQVEASVWAAAASVVTGALAGLIVDLKAGGLTFGGGAILGGIGGGLGTWGLIKTYHLVHGQDNKLHWSKEHFREQIKLSLLSYLAVAHFGRGRGNWKDDVKPNHWQEIVSEVVESKQSTIDKFWDDASTLKSEYTELNREMEQLVRGLGREILDRLYPKEPASFVPQKELSGLTTGE